MKIAKYCNQKIYDLNREDRLKGKPFFLNLKISEDKLHCDPRCYMWRGDYCWVHGFLKTDDKTGECEHIRSGECFSKGEQSEGLKAKAEEIPSIDPEKKMYIGYGVIIEGFFENYQFDKDKITEHFRGLKNVFVQNDYIRWLTSEYRNNQDLSNMDIFEQDNKEKEINLFFKPFHKKMDKNWPLSPEPPFETMGFDIEQVFFFARSFQPRGRIEYFQWVIKEAEIAKNKKAPEGENINDYIEGLEKFQKAIGVELEYLKKWIEPGYFGIIENENEETNVVKNAEHANGTGKPIEPIRWTGSLPQLIYLLKELRRRGFTNYPEDSAMLKEIIESHFIDKNGECFENIHPQISDLKKRKGGVRKKAVIDEIMENLPKKE